MTQNGSLEADVVVLGLGSAGEVVAGICAGAGLRVVAVESGLVGGQCPYHACIPSKSLDLVLATGSSPIVPPLPGLDGNPFWTSDQALSAVELPRRLVILGGGPVGCELAQAFARFGSEVTLVESGPELLPSEPDVIGQVLAAVLRDDGVRVCLAARAERVDGAGVGAGITVRLDDGTAATADRVLVATGRRPNTYGIGVERLGIDAEKGLTPDAYGRVGDGVWAIGDVTAAAPFTHMATYAARAVAQTLLGRPHRLDLSAAPRAVYTDPTVLCVGITPRQAREQRIPLLQAGFDLDGTARAYVEGIARGRVEIYAGEDGRVLGAAAVAPRADDLMGQAVLAVRAGVDVRLWAEVIQPFPGLSEAFGEPVRELAGRVGRSGVSSRGVGWR
jgi:pyruvate/2-oxoglutarate dehydrogenase complex dihydrolipoamide dehydrogenase (E3) component